MMKRGNNPRNNVRNASAASTPNLPTRNWEKTLPGKNNEIQLTDAMREMVKTHPMYGMKFEGKRYDVGNKMGFLQTNIEFGLKDPEIVESLKDWIKEFAKGL